jgi:hypothetical protein
LLEIGPKIGDFLVVLHADKCHPGAGHLLHRSADIFRERFVAPGNAGRLVGGGVVEALEGARLAAVNAVERRPELLELSRIRRTNVEPLLRASVFLRQDRGDLRYKTLVTWPREFSRARQAHVDGRDGDEGVAHW